MSIRDRIVLTVGTVLVTLALVSGILVQHRLETDAQRSGVSRLEATAETARNPDTRRIGGEAQRPLQRRTAPEPLLDLLDELMLLLPFLAVLLALPFLWILWIRDRRLHRSLRRVSDAMAETAVTGRLGRTLSSGPGSVGSHPEVERLEASFSSLMETVEKSLRDRERSYVEAVGAVLAATDARDHETSGHSFRVARYALVLARALGIEGESLRAIEWGALLHDVGKIAVPDAILRKADRLTEDEWHVMRQHPAWGFEMLADVQFLGPALEIVYSHHERWDGDGYPRGLEREEIPLAARIFAVVDTYDSITSDRPYRPARTHAEAKTELRRVAGTQLDPDVVEAFLLLPEVELRRLREGCRRLELSIRSPEATAAPPAPGATSHRP